MEENHLKITKGFRALLTGFAPYIARELKISLGDNWWKHGVIGVLSEDQIRDLPVTND